MRKTGFQPWGVAAFLIALALAGVSGAAEPPKDNPAPEQAKIEDGDKVQVQMQDVEIRGELERPEVFYIIPRRKARMDTGSMKKDYDGEILVPIMPEAFEAAYGAGQAKEE